MKKITSIFIFLIVFATSVEAQTPQYFNSSALGGSNSIPFNSGGNMVWRRTQFGIPANSIGTVGSGNNIVKIYFLPSTTANVTYPTFTVRLKTGSGSTGMVGTGSGPFESGMTVVLTATNFNMITTANTWYGITLATPFLYDPTMPLIVDFEHNHTSAAGPSVNQPGIVSLGNGRQWGDVSPANISGIGTQLLDFGIDVIPATPCTVTPGPNTVVGPTTAICPNSSAMLSFATTYSFGGITYQWQSSTTSSVGPFTSISGATTSIYGTPNLTVQTWFNAVVTCTNVSGSITTTAGVVNISAITTSTAPYFESFEGIGSAGKLPNCSWAVSSINTCQTYTSSNTNGRIPRTGTSFASFYFTPAATNYFYTNGIYLNTGITYKASVWYQTEYIGYGTWMDLSLMIGTAQTPASQTVVATSGGPAISNVYKELTNTFTVPSSGYYYMAIKGQSGGPNGAQYLSWDDLSITIPCTGNNANVPNLIVTASSNTICSSSPLNLTATGANTFTWNTGANGSVLTENPIVAVPTAINYSVTGTNTLSGCTNTMMQTVMVNPVPDILVFANNASVCAGSQVILTAFGASTYTWNTGATGSQFQAAPTSNITYTVLGTNSYNCSSVMTQAIQVFSLPNVTASSSSAASDICKFESATLTGGGATSYVWISSTSSNLMQGNTISVSPLATTIYTVTGTNANGCKASTTVLQGVSDCVGINEVITSASGIKVYPNPTSSEFTVESNDNLSKTVEVIDVSGRIILTQNLNQQTVKLNLAGFAGGIYYIKIKSSESVEVVKLLKQ